jgi:hypothetical protein
MRGGGGVIESWTDIWNDHSIDGKSWEWTCRFWGDGIVWGGDMDREPRGVGDLMRIVLLSDPIVKGEGDPKLLPVGKYTINGSGRLHTAVWGGYDGSSGGIYHSIWGSWYVDYNNLPLDNNGHYIEPLKASLIGGTIEVEYNPDTKIYNIIVDAMTDGLKSVKVDFEGPLALNRLISKDEEI